MVGITPAYNAKAMVKHKHPVASEIYDVSNSVRSPRVQQGYHFDTVQRKQYADAARRREEGNAKVTLQHFLYLIEL